MMHEDLVGEVLVYVRKISVVHDWYNFVYAKGYLEVDDAFRRELSRDEVDTPSSTVVRTMDKSKLVQIAGPLSLYAATLEASVHRVFRTHRCRGIMRYGITSMLEKIETGEVPHNWHTPFTAGLGGIDALFRKADKAERTE